MIVPRESRSEERLRMTEDEARKVELVRAVEIEDSEAVLLTREDRQQADSHARSREPAIEGRASEQRFIARRAEFAAARLTTRHPGVAELVGRSGWPGWVGWVVPLVSLAAGFLASELGTGKRLDLLAVPLLGTIAWNLLVYLGLIVAAVCGSRAATANPMFKLLARITGAAGRSFAGGTPLHRAANAFQQRWAERSAMLNGARIARTLHLAAALFAGGLIAGIYLRALVIEYRAGWESTFLDPGAVHALLSAVLGPASLLTGVAIPPVAEIAAMRWIGAGGGVNAGPWIHLYTATVVGLVIAPRLLLAFAQGARAMYLARNLPMPGREVFYVRRLLRAGGAKRGMARITPYAYRPGEETRRRVTELLRRALGDGAEVRFDDPIDYGTEEHWLTAHPLDPANDYHILLFTLSATPEAENHGALAAALTRSIADEHSGTVAAALIDESPFRSHFAGQEGLEERIAVRLSSWRRVLGDAGLTALPLDLSRDVDEAVAQRIEAGLLADGAMRR
jgi:hypothetical protein